MSFKWINSRKTFEKSNLTYCPETGRGYSYGWYRIVDRIGGKVVLNTYQYSKSTGRHITHIVRLLSELGVKIDVSVEAPNGLQNHGAIQRHYRSMIEDHEAAINAKGSRKATNQKRLAAIDGLKQALSRYNETYASKILDEEITNLLKGA